MKKQKIVCIIILFILISINFKYLIFGNIDNKRNILTIEDATEKAIKNNPNIESKLDSIPITLEREKNLREIVCFSTDPISIINANAQLMEIQMKRATTFNDIEVIKDNIKFSITNYFASIIDAEKALELYEDKLKIEEKELLVLKTKSDLGLESKLNYETKKNDYEASKNRIFNFISSINNAYRSLNSLIGEENLDTKYNLDLNLKFKKINDIDINYFTNICIDQSAKVKLADNTVKVNQYKLDSYISSVYDFAIKQSRQNPLSREEIISELKESGKDAQKLKESIKNKIVDTYNKIKEKEKEIEVKNIQLEKNYKELKVLEIKLNMGKILNLDLEKFKHFIKEQEEDLRKSKIEYILITIEFENPNILLGNL